MELLSDNEKLIKKNGFRGERTTVGHSNNRTRWFRSRMYIEPNILSIDDGIAPVYSVYTVQGST